jgi:hypothetical protein
MREKPKVITSLRTKTDYEREEEKMRRHEMKVLWFLYGTTTAFLIWIWSHV